MHPFNTTKTRLTLALSASLFALAACGGGDSSAPVITSTPIAPVNVRIIATNDFHGNIDAPAATNGGTVVLASSTNAAGVPVRAGGAAYLATLVKQLKAANPNNIVVGAGDIVSAAPVTPTLTHQEAAIDVMNQIGLEVSSVGNHEFDQGMTELNRWQNGGCYPGGTIGVDTCLQNGTFTGAKWKYLSANVVDATGKTILPGTYIKTFGDVRVGFIGLTLKGTPSVVSATGVKGLTFLDEVSTINTTAAALKKSGVEAIVVLIHQGGQSTASLFNDKTCPGFNGEIAPIVDGLSKDVDVIVSGHTHQEYVCSRNGKLLTQTGFYGNALTAIDLTIQPGVGVTAKKADNVPVINDLNTALPSNLTALAPDSAIAGLVKFYNDKTAAIQNLPVGTITAPIMRALFPNTTNRDETAEGAMGDVMADVYLNGGPQADFAFVNPGGVRADLPYNAHGVPGQITYGDLLTVAPFGNTLVTVDMTVPQIVRLLENQWEAPNCAAKTGANGCGRLLQPSANFTYTWDNSKPAGAPVGQGARVVVSSIKLNGQPLDSTKTYRITFNSFMAPGPGDNFTAVTSGTNVKDSQVKDIDALVSYVKAHPNLAPPAPRVTRIN